MTYDKLSMTKSHGVVLVIQKYVINKITTFTMQIRISMDNINEQIKK